MLSKQINKNNMYLLIPIEPGQDQQTHHKAVGAATTQELAFAAGQAEAECKLNFIYNEKIPGQWLARDENKKVWAVIVVPFRESWAGRYAVNVNQFQG